MIRCHVSRWSELMILNEMSHFLISNGFKFEQTGCVSCFCVWTVSFYTHKLDVTTDFFFLNFSLSSHFYNNINFFFWISLLLLQRERKRAQIGSAILNLRMLSRPSHAKWSFEKKTCRKKVYDRLQQQQQQQLPKKKEMNYKKTLHEIDLFV